MNYEKLFDGFWGDTMAITCFIQWKKFTSTLKAITPYKTLYCVKPNVNNFKIFGCLAYVHIPIEFYNKLEMKSHKCIFLGYGDIKVHKNYWFYDKTNKFFIFRKDVVFDEKVMFLTEERVTFDAFVYDLAKGKDESFMPLGFWKTLFQS